MNKVLFTKDINFLSYYQSTLRNVLVLSTLSMAFIREALVYKNKNKFYNLVYLIFGFIFLLIGFSLNYFLLRDTKIYKTSKKNSEQSKDIQYDLIIIYVMFVIMLLFMLFTIYRIIQNMIYQIYCF